MKYEEFIESKIIHTADTGFDINDADMHESNMPHQRDIIKWAAKGGCRAVFASFGLGKSQMQLELARITTRKFGGAALIICPLGVRQEFKADAERIGMQITYVRNSAEVQASLTQVMITNYERVRDGDIDIEQFIFVSLDEASVLRSFGSKTYQEFLPRFRNVPYKYVFTATPSPNRYKELIHYAGFLGIMDTGQALTRFFKRDSQKAGNLTLYEHKQREFWLWVSSWATFLTRPSDLGYSDQGYDLPPINIHWHRIETSEQDPVQDRDGSLKIFKDQAIDLQSAAREKRDSVDRRMAKVMEIITGDTERHWLVWHDLEREREAIERTLPEARTVFGSQRDTEKEELLIGFSRGEYRILATKPDIAGQGCNFQKHCHGAIFMGIGYKFNDFIQAIHRIHRFQQQHACDIHIIYTDAEDNVRKELEAKWRRHDELVGTMTGIIREYGLNHDSKLGELKRSIGLTRNQVSGQFFEAINNDAVHECQQIKSDTIGLIHTSIPFSNHYEYTPSYNDFGHNEDDDRFFAQMDYLVPEWLRILMPGRIAAIHVKDRIMYGNVTCLGMPSVNPFSDKTTACMVKHGFIFIGRITVVTDVVRENNQTYRLGWSEQCKDGSKMGCGMPEYILLFRKLPTDTSKAYADIPVTKSKGDYTRAQWQVDAHGYWRSSGNRFLSPEELASMGVNQVTNFFRQYSIANIYDYHRHVAIGKDLDAMGKLSSTFMTLAPESHSDMVWTDVVRMRTLNAQQTKNNVQNHICPLQLDIVERIITRYSNPGDIVHDSFAGLFTVPSIAVSLGRFGHGTELNPMYWKWGVGYCREAEHKRTVPTLFDFLETGEKGN